MISENDMWAIPDSAMPSIFTTANVSDTSRQRYFADGTSAGSVAPIERSPTESPGILGGLKNWFSGTPLSLAWKSDAEIAANAKEEAKQNGIFASFGDWVSGTLTKVIVVLVLLFAAFLFIKGRLEH